MKNETLIFYQLHRYQLYIEIILAHRCRIALESSAGRFRIGGQPEDLFDLMNYSDQESCQIEDCEDSLESQGLARSSFSALASRDRFLADESIIGDDQSRNEHNCRTKRSAETNRQLTRRRHYEKKTTRWYGDRQYHHKEPPNKPGTSEPRLRIKSMHSKITRQNQRRVVPNRYLNGDPERPNETFDSTTVSNSFKQKRGALVSSRYKLFCTKYTTCTQVYICHKDIK